MNTQQSEIRTEQSSFQVTETHNRLSISDNNNQTEHSEQLCRAVNDSLQLSVDERSFANEQTHKQNASLLENLQDESVTVTVKPQTPIDIVHKTHSEQIQIPEQIKKQVEERKRKRKQIFAKFTKRQTTNVLAGTGQNSRLSVLQTFDQIFSIRSPRRSQQSSGVGQSEKRLGSNESKKQHQYQSEREISQFGRKSLPNIIQAQKTRQNLIVKRNQFASPQLQKYHTQQSERGKLTEIAEEEFNQLPSADSLAKQQAPCDHQNGSPLKRQSSDSFDVFEKSSTSNNNIEFSTSNVHNSQLSELSPQKPIDPNKISLIRPTPNDQSRESVDIEGFLQSELFQQERLDYTIKQEDTSYKNVQLSVLNPSMMMSNQSSTWHKDNSNKKAINNFSDRFAVSNDINKAKLSKGYEEKQENKHLFKDAYVPDNSQQNQQQHKEVLSPFELQDQNQNKQTENIKFQQKEKPLLTQPAVGSQQERIPPYLRQVRHLNTILPNFNGPNLNSQMCFEYLNQFRQLVKEFKKVVSFLNSCNEKIYLKKQILKKIDSKLMSNLTVQNFVCSDWQSKVKAQNLSQVIRSIRPRQNFIKREYNFLKVKQALKNYQQITQYYEKTSINLKQKKAQIKYLEVRNKFWQIEKNLKMIGEDIYMTSVEETFPAHYFEYLYVLKGTNKPKKTNERVQYLRKVLGMQYRLKSQGDILSMSEIGQKVRQVAEGQLHRSVYA